MLYLSAFFGRTVTHVSMDDKTILKFSDFSMIFLTRIDYFSDSLNNFVGQKFLYIQKHDNSVHFHFSSELYLSVEVDPSSDNFPQYMMLRSKEKEMVLRIDDGKAFDDA